MLGRRRGLTDATEGARLRQTPELLARSSSSSFFQLANLGTCLHDPGRPVGAFVAWLWLRTLNREWCGACHAPMPASPSVMAAARNA